MVRTASGHTARFNIWTERYIQMGQISQDMDNFIFSILLRKQQNDFERNQTRDAWPKWWEYGTGCCDKIARLLSYKGMDQKKSNI
jgi:hypothetical protein